MAFEEHPPIPILDAVPALVWSGGPDGRADYVNPSWSRFTGRERCDLIGSGWHSALHPDDLRRVLDALTPAHGETHEFQMAVRVRNSGERYQAFLISISTNPEPRDGSVSFCAAAIKTCNGDEARDASDAPSPDRDSPWTRAPMMVWSARADGYLDFVNDRWMNHTGLTLDEARGSGWQSAIHPDDLNGALLAWRKLIDSRAEGACECRMGSKARGYRWSVSVANPLCDVSGSVIRWYGALLDIEDRKRAEDKLGLSQDCLDDAQRLTRTGSFAFDPRTGALCWSREMYRIYGYEESAKPSLDRILARTHHEDVGNVARVFDQIAVERHDVDTEHRLLMPDGTIKEIRMLAHPVIHRGNLYRYAGTVIDVTEARASARRLQEAHAELAHATRIATLGELTASIAHEVSQPLTAIETNGAASLRWLRRDTPDLQEVTLAIERIRRDARRANDVIRQLRALARKDVSARKPGSINAVIRDALPLAQSQLMRDHVTLELDLDVGLPRIELDVVQMQQVIINLVTNASQAMSGIVDRARKLTMRTLPNDRGGVRVIVRDAGTGFPDNHNETMFTPFFTTKPNGMGMGLSISRTIIESHGGTIWMLNNAGPGAQVIFDLPGLDDRVA
ncbi:PAS domain-containing sensor histidine kinase [Paraburkholderia humisilvae]|uniref:histidine kinase n=1 Tax=Paraburkholderia humisilvae TaxID=627669 RepID=A0A6J5DG81_9BURK|nr:PAS domain-containing sensor histidine kinase [Paraburkholderia humisilvae]CAB3751886.1 Adaptive-response sensory-kinase SasA [Paraburkholderia humisilvae]